MSCRADDLHTTDLARFSMPIPLYFNITRDSPCFKIMLALVISRGRVGLMVAEDNLEDFSSAHDKEDLKPRHTFVQL
jgi:hypothetical protein